MRQDLYNEAVEADDRFEEAFKKQFGEKVTRWDVNRGQFNDETLAAYNAKLEADANLIKGCKDE